MRSAEVRDDGGPGSLPAECGAGCFPILDWSGEAAVGASWELGADGIWRRPAQHRERRIPVTTDILDEVLGLLVWVQSCVAVRFM